MKSWFLFLLLAFCVTAEKKANKKEKKADLSHGFRTEIDWVRFDQAVGIAKDLNKPIFLLIHKTWCGACKGLKREFNSNVKMGDLIELSKKFVMVNTEDDEEPDDSKYAPDGGYIPRILFLTTDAQPLSVKNDKRYPNNAYFYPLVPQVIDGMERALKEFSELENKEAGDNEASEEKPESVEKKETKDDEKVEEEKKEEKKEEVKEKKKVKKVEKREEKEEELPKKEKVEEEEEEKVKKEEKEKKEKKAEMKDEKPKKTKKDKKEKKEKQEDKDEL